MNIHLSPDLAATLKELGYEKLTPIQAESLPVLLDGRDLVGQSKTGSGKTAAFAIPILEKIDLAYRDVQALILCPTRELCEQVAREIRKLGRKFPGFQVLIVSGGQPGRPQSDSLRVGVHVVVGTPGRVLDHIRRGNLNLQYIKTLVLDEADRMLDMGFEEEMTMIMEEAPPTRQTVFFSATMPDSFARMSARYQSEPVHITIIDDSEKPSIEQIVFDSSVDEKPANLLRLLHQFQPQSAIVFCNLKVTVASLAETLIEHGVTAGALHGDLEQEDRNKMMAMFRNGSLRVLVATDVAARGLDVKDLDLVVNYDLSLHLEDYTHRIGRTGRAGAEGRAVTLASSRDRLRLTEFSRESGYVMADGDYDNTFTDRTKMPFVTLESKMSTLYVSGGRKDKVRPGDILGALTGETAGLSGADIGKIEIFDRFAYVAVAKGRAADVVDKLKVGKIKGRQFFIRLVK